MVQTQKLRSLTCLPHSLTQGGLSAPVRQRDDGGEGNASKRQHVQQSEEQQQPVGGLGAAAPGEQPEAIRDPVDDLFEWEDDEPNLTSQPIVQLPDASPERQTLAADAVAEPEPESAAVGGGADDFDWEDA